jgi:hypothetical protein
MNVGTASHASLILLCLCAMLIIWGVGFGLERIPVTEGVASNGIQLTSNGLTAIYSAPSSVSNGLCAKVLPQYAPPPNPGKEHQ